MTFTEISAEAGAVGSAPVIAIEGRSPWQLAWRRLRTDKIAVASGIVILVLIALALAAPLIARAIGHAPDTQYTNTGLTATGLPVPPNGTFWFGTDYLGRDLFVRVLYGARVSLLVGIASTVIGATAGTVAGVVAGYLGGVPDSFLARFMDAVIAFPYVLLAIALVVVFGPSLLLTIAVIAFFSWAAIARVVRGQTLSLKEKEFVEAGRSVGFRALRVMFVDILPNLLAPVIVLATLAIPNAIVFEATLSFLGAGIQPPTPSWGNILAEAQNFYQVAWWYLVFPAGFLLITTLAFNLLGDGVRDALDPTTERIFAARRKRKTVSPGSELGSLAATSSRTGR